MTFTPSDRVSDNLSKGAQVAFLVLIILAFGLRVTGLHQNSFWMDEIYTAQTAQQPITDLIDTVRKDIHPPGHFILLHSWMYAAGKSEFAVRFLSVAAGTLAVAALYAFGTLMLGRKVGLASAFLLAVWPPHIYYSQENRAYALLALLSLMTLYFVYAAVCSGHLHHWGGFVASAVVGLYMHYFSALAIGMASVLLTFFLVRNLIRNRQEDNLLASRRTLLAFAVCLVLIALCYTPWLPGIQAQYARRGGLPHALPVSPEFFRRIMFFFVGGGWGLVALSLVVIGYELVLGKRGVGFISPLLAVAAALSGTFAINRIAPSVTERNMIVVLPVFLFLVSAGLVRMGEHLLQLVERSRLKTMFTEGRRRTILSVWPLLLVGAISLRTTVGVYTINKTDWRGAAQYLARTAREGDVVLVAQFPGWLSYYLERRDADLLILDALNLENGLVDQAPDLSRLVGAWWVLFDWSPWSAQDLASVLGQDFTVDTNFFQLAIIHHEHVLSRDGLLLYSAEVLEAIASIKPNYPFQPLVEAANLYTVAGREDLAIRIYLRAGEQDLPLPSLHLRLGEYYMESGNTEAALHEFERTVELEVVGSLAFQASMHLGGYYQNQGEPEKATQWYTNAAERMPAWASVAYVALGRMYHKQGRMEEALQAYQQAITQPEDPQIVTYYHEMAQIYEEMERPDDAMYAYRAVLDLQPDNVTARERLRTLQMQEQVTLSLPLLEFKGYPEEFQEIAVTHFEASGDFLMAWNGSVSSPPTLLNPGVYILQVEAHGQPALGENPEMTMEVSITGNGGDRRVIAMDVFSVGGQTSVYTSSSFELASQTTVVVSISFFNDYDATDGDRNLFIRRVWIAYAPSE